MATEIKIRRGTAAQNAAFTGVEGEVTYSTDQKRLITHDGATVGGTLQATKAEVDAKQPALGFTPENVANKDTDGTLAANSDVKYASQKATKTYADTKQSALGFTPENVANKDTDGTLAANSDVKYASQKATKTYADTKQSALGFTPENVANKSTDGTLSANSDTLYASQKATKTYADTKQAALGFTPENVANKSSDGTLAANSDTLYASQKATKTYADTKQAALGFTPENVANKDTDGTLAANSDVKYASQKATKTYADTKQAALGFTPENVANKDTDGTLAANSDVKYASQKATKTYADTKQSALGFTPENVANKDTDGTLAANSDVKYASQKATKTYADAVATAAASALSTGLALKVAKAGDSMTGTLTVTPATANTAAFVLGNNSAPAGDPTNASENWATGGEWQYRSSAASEGAGQTNRVHNRAEEVVGAGTDYSLTTTLAKVDFGTTDPEIVLPTAGTYLVYMKMMLLFSAVALSAGDIVGGILRNTTDSVNLTSSYVVWTNPSAVLGVYQTLFSQSVVTISASKTFQIWANNLSGARGIVVANVTNLGYVRLF